MNPPRFPCSRCHRGTTKKNLELDGMCGTCREVWTRVGYDTALERIPQEWEEIVDKAIHLKPTFLLAVTEVKKQTGSIRKEVGREWDMALLVMVDERRRRRAA